MTLAEVLAGPILRRVEPDRVCIWLATSRPHRVRATVLDPTSEAERPLGSGEAVTVTLGPRLHIHLVTVRPAEDVFPLDTLLAYDLAIEVDGQRRDLGALGLPGGIDAITYGRQRFPTFFIAGPRTRELNVLHGSCRLLHGKGQDSFLAADDVLAGTLEDLNQRPSALLLTGDQIYADEVGGPMIGHLGRLGAELLGPGDDDSVPGVPPVSSMPLYGRQRLAEEQAHFTSSKAQNHLFTLGEFAAGYLVAWGEANWPEDWPDVDDLLDAAGAEGRARQKLRSQFDQERDCLDEARRALPRVRRVLANVATYAVFDDHDVTDDWNLTRQWYEQVRSSPTGRRVVANALASFWAFQGWGNQSELFDEDFIETVRAGIGGDDPAQDRFDDTLWDFDRWSYRLPTSPPVIMLDTRTQRCFDSDRGAAWLIKESERRRVAELIGDAADAAEPVVLVSAVPVFGLELQERRQKFLAGRLGPYEIDFEAWHSNLSGFVAFMKLLIEDLGLRRCVIASGDVHYGINVAASFSIDGETLEVAQVVSSSFKHSGAMEKSALHALGRMVRGAPERVGWDRPPELSTSGGAWNRLMTKAANTDEWDEDSPVFIPKHLEGRLDADPPPCYRETRRYVDPQERPGWVVVGENNIGSLSVSADGVRHRLHTCDPQGAKTYTVDFFSPE